MSVPNVTAGQPITEAWGDAVADSVNALEAADAAHVGASNPHPSYATDADLTAHEGAANPHSGYATDADLTAHVGAADPHTAYATDTDLANHAAAANPHPTYATDADLTTHTGAADPHTGYQKESERAVANGYASLDAGGRVPIGQNRMQAVRGASNGSVAAAGGVDITVTWPTTWGDTAYTAIGQVSHPSVGNFQCVVKSKTATTTVFRVINASGGPQTPEVDAISIHD